MKVRARFFWSLRFGADEAGFHDGERLARRAGGDSGAADRLALAGLALGVLHDVVDHGRVGER